MTLRLNAFLSWFVYDPRRVFIVLFTIAMLLMLVAMIIPVDPALANTASGDPG